MYVRDLAKSLFNRGIHVEVYSPRLGKVASQIRKLGINVTDSLQELALVPDIIHGHHYEPTINALLHFRETPALYFVHARKDQLDTPVKHSRVIKFLASDYNTLDRLRIDEGIPAEHSEVFLNPLDTDRFNIRTNLREQPRRALVFSNYASENNYLPVVKAACGECGIELDCVGQGMGNEILEPELILNNYDIVFAKAKAAMEAMATGAAVIPCDEAGMATMVNRENYRHYRDYNFGMKILVNPIQKELLVREIRKYDTMEIFEVAMRIREEARIDHYTDRLLGCFHEVIGKYRNGEVVHKARLTEMPFIEKQDKITVDIADENGQYVNLLLRYKLEQQQKQTRELEDALANCRKSFRSRLIKWLARMKNTNVKNHG